MTKNILATSVVAVATTALLAIIPEISAQAASFNLNFPLIDDFNDTLGTGFVKFEAEPDSSKDLEKFAVSEFEVNLTVTPLDLAPPKTLSFTNLDEAQAVFFNGEFSGIEYRGASEESDNYFLLIDGGDEAIKPGEPGAWSIWGPNSLTGEVDTRVTGGINVAYTSSSNSTTTSVPEPTSLIGLGMLGLGLVSIPRKVKTTSNK